MFFDKEFGLYDSRGRMHNPILCRWMQRESAGYVDGMNLYEYEKSNPVKHIDPSGSEAGIADDAIAALEQRRRQMPQAAQEIKLLLLGQLPLRQRMAQLPANSLWAFQASLLESAAEATAAKAREMAAGACALAENIWEEGLEGGLEQSRLMIVGEMSKPYEARMLMHYHFGNAGEDVEDAIRSASGFAMILVDTSGLGEASYGLDYLGRRPSCDLTTGRSFEGIEQLSRGFTGTGQFAGTVAVLSGGTLRIIESGSELFSSSGPRYPSGKPVNYPQVGGRLGSQATRAHVADVAAELESRGWTVTRGGGRFPEEYLRGPGGGRLGSNWVDITAVKNGRILRINTIDTLANGLTPTAREAAAAAAIRAKTGGHLLLIPKP